MAGPASTDPPVSVDPVLHMRSLIFKLAFVFSSCGGPLFVTDWLKPTLGQTWAVAVALAPVAVAGFCMLSLSERDPWGKVAAGVGALGVAVVVLMNLFTAWHLAGGTVHPDRGLIILGIVVGTVGAVVCAMLTYRRLRA